MNSQLCFRQFYLQIQGILFIDTELVRVILSYRKYFNKDLIRSVPKMVQTLRKDCVETRELTHTVIHIDFIKNILRILLLIQGTELSECRRIKDQLDVTCYFISLLMCSKCFGH